MSTSVLYTTSVCIRIFSLPSTTSRVNLSWSVSFDWLTTVSVPFRSSGPVVETVVLRTRLWSRHLLWHIVWNLCNRLGASSCLEGMYPDGQWRTFPGFINGSIFQHRHSLVHYHFKCRASNMGSVSAVEFVNYVPSIVVSENLTSYAAIEARIAGPRRNSRSSVYVPQFRQPEKLRRNLGWRNQARTI
jgi:hypothetical protein